jgi:membrane-associated protein
MELDPQALVDALSGSSWSYALVLAIVAGDAVLPVFPGETAVIAGAILANAGRLDIPLVVLASIAGAMIGDSVSYGLGRTLGGRAVDRLARGEKARGRVEWSRRQLEERGAWLIVIARFIPGGRTATTLAAGTLHMPWPRFIAADAVGATIWSCYAAALGWFGGATFRESPWKPFLVALVLAALFGAVGEVVRRRLDRRERGSGVTGR